MRRKRECNAEPRGVDTSISSIQSGSNPLEDDLQAMALLTVPLTPTQQEERGEGGGGAHARFVPQQRGWRWEARGYPCSRQSHANSSVPPHKPITFPSAAAFFFFFFK